MALQIPQSAHTALKTLNSFSDQDAISICEVLAESRPSLTVKKLATEIAQKTKLKEDIEDIILTLASMYNARSNFGMSLEDFVEEVVEDAKETIPLGEGETWDPLKRHLSRLLIYERSLGVAAKALEVMTGHQNVFIDARLFTDMRPIFLNDPTSGPITSTIVHTLKLEYLNSDSKSSLYIAMDSKDIKQLQRVLDRALQKEQALRDFSEAAKLQSLNVDSYDE